MASCPQAVAPTAFVAASDQFALGALFWPQEHGVRVPEDVSVSGYHGIADTAYYWPPLTTMAVDFPRMGRNTVRALLSLQGIGGRPDLGMPVTELVPRASTGHPRRRDPRTLNCATSCRLLTTEQPGTVGQIRASAEHPRRMAARAAFTGGLPLEEPRRL